jgi:hypothetical protein
VTELNPKQADLTLLGATAGHPPAEPEEVALEELSSCQLPLTDHPV